jgi:hypothetical protein
VRITNKQLRKRIRKILLKEGTLVNMQGKSVQQPQDFSAAIVDASDFDTEMLPHLGGQARHLANQLTNASGDIDIYSSQLGQHNPDKLGDMARAEMNIGPMIDWKDPRWSNSPWVKDGFKGLASSTTGQALVDIPTGGGPSLFQQAQQANGIPVNLAYTRTNPTARTDPPKK